MAIEEIASKHIKPPCLVHQRYDIIFMKKWPLFRLQSFWADALGGELMLELQQSESQHQVDCFKE